MGHEDGKDQDKLVERRASSPVRRARRDGREPALSLPKGRSTKDGIEPPKYRFQYLSALGKLSFDEQEIKGQQDEQKPVYAKHDGRRKQRHQPSR